MLSAFYSARNLEERKRDRAAEHGGAAGAGGGRRGPGAGRAVAPAAAPLVLVGSKRPRSTQLCPRGAPRPQNLPHSRLSAPAVPPEGGSVATDGARGVMIPRTAGSR